MSEQKSSNAIYLIIIIILLLVVGFFLVNTFVKGGQMVESEDYKELFEQKEGLMNDYIDMKDELADIQSELYLMTGKNASLDSTVLAYGDLVKKKQQDINYLFRQGKITKEELASAKQMIDSLRIVGQNYLLVIDSLYQVNEMLLAENQELQYALGEEKKKTETLEIKSAYLEDKFEIGSILPVSNLEGVGIQITKKGAESITRKLNKMDKCRICFQTGVNNVREPGNVTMQIRVIDPAKNVITGSSSGNFTDAKTEKKLKYSKKIEFDYNNSNKRICSYWEEGMSQEGNYKIEVYQDGYKVSETFFELK